VADVGAGTERWPHFVPTSTTIFLQHKSCTVL